MVNQTSQILEDIVRDFPAELNYLQIHRSRLAYLFNKFKRMNLKGKRVLELGCYPMILFRGLQALGAETYGIAGPHEKIGLRNVRVVDLNQGKISFRNDFFDLVVFSEVLEHLYCSPLAILRQIRRVLKKGARCVLTTPNAVSGINRVRLLLGVNIFARMESVIDENGGRYASYHWHHREYTRGELIRLSRLAGLGIGKTEFLTSFGPFRPGKKPPLTQTARWLNLALARTFPFLADTIYLELVKK